MKDEEEQSVRVAELRNCVTQVSRGGRPELPVPNSPCYNTVSVRGHKTT